jgi:hypothetical protein
MDINSLLISAIVALGGVIGYLYKASVDYNKSLIKRLEEAEEKHHKAEDKYDDLVLHLLKKYMTDDELE